MEATSRAKSVIYWTVDEVTYWMEAMGFDKFVVEEVKAQMVDGAGLVTLVNGAKLDSIGLCSKLKTQQLVWNLERKVERGDVTLKNALQLTNIQTQLRGGKLPKPRKGANRRAKQFNLIDLGDGEEGAVDVKEDGGEEEGEDEDDYDEDDEESDGERGNESAPAPLEFEVVFDADNPPNILLEEFQPGSRLMVRGFPRKQDGSMGAAEKSGNIKKGDFVVASNDILLDGFQFRAAIRLITSQKRPLALRFQRVPKHLIHHNFSTWSTNGLRTILEEEGVQLTGMEKHAQLAIMARRAFWDKPVPLPPSPPRIEEGATAIVNGETSICGWLIVKGPCDSSGRRLFCDLHGSELLFHEPKGPVTEQGGLYESAPSEALDINRITIVEHTRTSEEGTKDLRMVHEEGSVWLLSANKDEAIRRWHRQLLTAQIIGPGTRTSGSSVPSAPFLISRTHNSMTVMWLPPRQPYLNTVHSFQVEYKKGMNPLNRWIKASDEVHSTKLVIKGLESREKYIVRVRAVYTRRGNQGKLIWGDWSHESNFLMTMSTSYQAMRPKEHLWVLVHDLRGDPDDMRFMKQQLEARCGTGHEVMVATSSSGALETLDGVDKGGRRLYEEIVLRVEAMRTLRCISFVCHGLGGLYARYALHLMDERGILGVNVRGAVFATFGTPHLGSVKVSSGIAGSLFGDDETIEHLRFKDRSAKPLLLRMCRPEFTSALFQFERRIAYANISGGDVEHVSASVRSVDPYAGMTPTQLAPMVSKQYDKILALEADIRQQSPSDPARMKLEMAAGPPGEWMEAAEALSVLGWTRIDVFNTGLGPHQDLVVASPILTKDGETIVRHFVDSVFGEGGVPF